MPNVTPRVILEEDNMAVLKNQKEDILRKFRRNELDTGSSEVQVALLTAHIKDLTEHFKRNKNDVHSRRGLVKMVNRRRKLLDYLRRTDPKKYSSVIGELGIRK
jgi:small subunit ribosomal protein S15